MSTVLSHDAFHESVGHAFNELLVLEQLSQLPPDAILRVLQSIPEALLRQALGTAALPQPAAKPEERRAYPRRPVLRGGKLILNHGRTLLDVQVRDLSEGGCRIRTGNPALLPGTFTIRIVGLSGERPCEVRWRSEQELGVRFLNC